MRHNLQSVSATMTMFFTDNASKETEEVLKGVTSAEEFASTMSI